MKPDDIPQDVWQKADEVDCGFLSGHRGLYVDDIARAILAATAAEREACAKQAEDFARRVMPKDHRSYVFDLAAAIRNRGAQP